jgi:hypothetical protein
MATDPEEMQSIAYRDQAWAGLRRLLPEIEHLANGGFTGTEREKQLIQVLAGVVAAELSSRADNTGR